MKKIPLLAIALTVLLTSQAMAAPHEVSSKLSLTSATAVTGADIFFSSSSDEMRAFRNWKRESEAEKIEKEYRQWKREHSDSRSSSDKYHRERMKKQEDKDYKAYEKWKKKNPRLNKTFKEWQKEWNLDKETREFNKWIKKHRKDWKKWDKDGFRERGFKNTDGGEGDGSGGAE